MTKRRSQRARKDLGLRLSLLGGIGLLALGPLLGCPAKARPGGDAGCACPAIDGGSPLDAGADAGPDAGPDAGLDGGATALDGGWLCPPPVSPASPLAYGQLALTAALTASGSSAAVQLLTVDEPGAQAALTDAGVTLDARPESFAIVAAGGGALIVGRDETGAMYGALELAERLGASDGGILPLSAPIADAPAVPIRAANLFLVLPAANESPWWFLSLDFWTEYLDLLARSRIDYLDLHGMYDLDNTNFPNALLWFGTSASFPEVGVPAAERAQNLAMLDTVVQLAAVRGIRVGLMSYSSNLSFDAQSPPEWQLDDASLQIYTREAAADVARRGCGLSRLGFRIGETNRDAAWYIGSFVAGVQDAANGTLVSTRTWGTTKADILSVVQASPGETIVEAKYNGEQLGPPYALAGGLLVEHPGWTNYSYEDYLAPPWPYSFVFQVRMGGTHRIFREASYLRAVRAVGTFTLSASQGFTLEPPHAYLPQEDFYHVNPADRFSPWAFRRDELTYLLYGRLSYDPATPPAVFERALADRVGTPGLWDPVQAASDIVPWIQTAHTCGPDQRNFAPELELAGTVAYWASPAGAQAPPYACGTGYHGPFDLFAVASPYDAAGDLLKGGTTTRLSPIDVAKLVLADAAAARAASGVAIDPANPEARDVARECVALADLGDYFGHKLRAATALAVYAGSGSADFLSAARAETQAADAAWTSLANDTAYLAPFEERMRMQGLGLFPFHWKLEVPRLAADPASIDSLVSQLQASPPPFTGTLPPASTWLSASRPAGPGLSALTITPLDPNAPSWTVAATLGGVPAVGSTVEILWKPFSGDADWQAVPATGSGTAYQATIASSSDGALFAVRVAPPSGLGWRYPDLVAATPYVVLAPR